MFPFLSSRFFFFLRFYLFIFREKGSQGEKEGEKHQCVVASCMPPTGDLASSPGMCSDWKLKRMTLWFAACDQPTEPQIL